MEFEQFVQLVHLSSESPIRVATDDDSSQHRDLLLGHGSGNEAFVSASILVSLAGPIIGRRQSRRVPYEYIHRQEMRSCVRYAAV